MERTGIEPVTPACNSPYGIRADVLARERRDDSAATHAAQRGDGPILGDEQRSVARERYSGGADADARRPNVVSLTRDLSCADDIAPASVRANQEHPAAAGASDGDVEPSHGWEHRRRVDARDLVQLAARMVDPDHPTPRVGHPEVAARVVSQAVWAVDALTNGHESLEPSSAQIHTQYALLDRGDREVPTAWVDVDPDDAWDACHGRDAASRDEAPHDTVVDVGDVQLSGAVLGEGGDLSEPCAQSRFAVSADSGLALACDSDESSTLCVVPQHLMAPGVGDEDAALVDDE